jgi:2-polyprenyl-3-methyl-5-hydroxy-6-metoxy-1,4-benzoquinol methylase
MIERMQSFQRIARAELAVLTARCGNHGTPPQYTHANPLVREMVWRRLEKLMALSKAPPGRRVLDFGGGNGILTPTLSNLYREVVCVDLHPEMAVEVVRARALENVQVHREELTKLELPAGSFDTIVAADVLEHLTDFAPVVREFRRLLAPGGELLVSAPSENLLYAVARLLFGYQKPADHYHAADGIERGVGAVLPVTARRCFPIDTHELSFFWLMRFARPLD